MKPAPPARCYTVPALLAILQIPERTFYRLRDLGQLPFLEELSPRLGKRRRYRADLVDAYLAGRFGRRPARKQVA
jgi:hypothetical protein